MPKSHNCAVVRGRSWRRSTTTLAALVLLASCATSEPGGASTPESAVAAYVAALNAKDQPALRRLASEQAPAPDKAIARRLSEHGGRDLHITSQDIQSPVPHQAAAHLTGTMSSPSGQSETYTERLLLDRGDERWYIKMQPSGPPASGGPLPTADTTRSS